MNAVLTKLITLLALSGVSLTSTVVSALDPVKSPYQIRFGTLEMTEDLKRAYVFRWDSSEEVFDLSGETLLSSKGIKFPGLPDLKEIGFRTKSGKVFEYGDVGKKEFVERFTREHPGETGDVLIFRGLLAEDLEMNIRGKTLVCRVDLERSNGPITLWKNVPAQSNANEKSQADR